MADRDFRRGRDDDEPGKAGSRWQNGERSWQGRGGGDPDDESRGGEHRHGTDAQRGPQRGEQDDSGGRSRGGPGAGSSFGTGNSRDLGDRNPSQGFTGGFGGAGQAGHAGRGSKNYKRSDARIEEEVHELLMRHHGIDATDIDVHVENGEVTLTGEVEDRGTKRLAEEVVEQCAGVHDVHNKLKARRGIMGAISQAVGKTDETDRGRGSTDRDVTASTINTRGTTADSDAGRSSKS